ncbi:MAG: hypothetical protein AAB134_06045, partial [Pseudomonadota bacterium]
MLSGKYQVASIKWQQARQGLIFLLLATCHLLLVPEARAVLTIEITKGMETGVPIAIVPFSFEVPKLPQNVSDVIQADLTRSGRFSVLPRKDFVATPHEDKEVVFKDWRVIKAEALVIGSVRPA